MRILSLPLIPLLALAAPSTQPPAAIAAAIDLLKPFATLPPPVPSSPTTTSSPLVKTPLGDSVCLDGSPFSAYIREGDPHKVVMFLEGGGLCIERVDCAARALTTLGSSTAWEESLSKPDNVLSLDEGNPFKDWTHVFMRYCSGDTWTGTNTRESGPGRYDLYFSGHNMVEETLEYMAATYGIGGKHTELLLSGASAGGIGTNNNCDFVAEKYPDLKVSCSPQSGLFFPENTVPEWQKRVGLDDFDFNHFAGVYVSEMFDSYLDRSCVEYAEKVGDRKEWCWDSGYLSRHIDTRVLVAQNFWDQLQISDILCWEDQLFKCPKSFMEAFKNSTVSQLVGLADEKDQFSIWLPSCFEHTENMCLIKDDVTQVEGVSYAKALQRWYFGGENLALVDDCDGRNKDSVACNKVCSMGCG